MQKHKFAINALMLNLIQEYIVSYARTEQRDIGVNELHMLQMYAGDVVRNAKALEEFNATGDYLILHEAIMLQDTIVREHFFDVLEYIESNKLVNEGYFACS